MFKYSRGQLGECGFDQSLSMSWLAEPWGWDKKNIDGEVWSVTICGIFFLKCTTEQITFARMVSYPPTLLAVVEVTEVGRCLAVPLPSLCFCSSGC